MRDRTGEESGAYEGGRYSFSSLFPHMAHDFESSDFPPLNTHPTNLSTTSLGHSSQPVLSPFAACSFTEVGKITQETLSEQSLRLALEEPWNPLTQVTMEQPIGNEFGAYGGSGDSLSFLPSHPFHNLEFSDFPFLNTAQTNKSTINPIYLSQPYLYPTDACTFSEIGEIVRETLPELSLRFALEGLCNPPTQVRSSQSPWQFGDDPHTFVSWGQAMQQQPSQGGFQAFSPPNQDTPEWGSTSSNTNYTNGSSESVSSPTIATPTSFIPSPTSHPEPPKCLLVRQHQTNLLQTQNSHTNRSKEGNDKPEKCPLCPKTAITVRDINRHLWSQHPQFADQFGVKSEMRDCPFQKCRYRGRRDNVNRHYKAKHGGCIKWNRGGVLVS